MKKKFLTLVLILVAVIGISGFAQSEKSATPMEVAKTPIEVVKDMIIENVNAAPSGTVYGIVESTSEKYVVNTPVGKYDVEKKNGGFECLGVYAKVVSHKGSSYKIESSLGTFTINTKKCTVVKQ